MRFQDVPQRGKRGELVASRNHFGPYWKQYKPPKQPGTPAQRQGWGNMAYLSQVWNDISDERRDGWHRLAQMVHGRPTLAHYGSLDGILLFKKLNRVLYTCGRETLLDPPPLPRWGPNPVVGFAIREGRGGTALKLKLCPGLVWEDRPPLEDVMVYAWAPRNPGVRVNGLWAFLGLVSKPIKDEAAITELYRAKLQQWRKLKPEQYHLPFAGSRIFVRAWQQVNGWENELGMFRADSLVPTRKWPHWAVKNAEK